MADVTAQMAQAFEAELTKIAFSPAGLLQGAKQFVARQGSTIGGMAGMGGLIGAGGGAALGGYKGYQQAREQGAGVGRSLLGAGGGAVSGGLRGGAYGAAAGGLAGAVGGQEAAKLVQDVGMKNSIRTATTGKGTLLGGASRFGQRQAYGLTGALPEGAGSAVAKARSIGAGASDQAARYQTAKGALSKLQAPGAEMPKTFFGRQLNPAEAISKAEAELGQARQGYQHAMKLERMGATSVPGYMKALWKDPGAVLKHGIGEQWHGSGTVGKAVAFGVPAAFAAQEIAKTPGEGQTRAGNIGRAIGGSVIGMTPVPLAGMLALGTIGTEGGGRVGKAVGSAGRAVAGKFRRAPTAPAYTTAGMEQGGGQVEAAGGNFMAPEYQYSNSAMGRGPEGWA